MAESRIRKAIFDRFFAEEKKRVYAKGYSDAGASHVKRALKGFVASSGAPIEDIDYNNKTLRQRCRMLYMAAPIATSAVNTTRTKVVGSGLKMRPAINRERLGLTEEQAEAWKKTVEAEWRLWSESKDGCDALGASTFYELEQIAVKSWLMSGDVFAVLKRDEPTSINPYSLRIQLIEADRVSTPSILCATGNVPISTEGKTKAGNKIHDGVEVDADGRIVAYHICNVYPNQYTSEGRKWERVAAVGEKTGIPNVLHIMDAERPDQYRGVSFIAPCIEMLLQLRRYTESELTAALVQSYLTAWIVTTTDTSDFPLNEAIGDIECEPGANRVSDDENEYEMGPGQINHLAPGENVVLGNPNIPTEGFESFMKTMCKIIGCSLEIPYDVLIKEFNSSYSSAKGALEEAWEMFKMRREWFVTDFCKPIYEAWLAEAVARGRISAPGFFTDPAIRKAWSGSRWDGPAQTHLDPVKEATANEKLVSHGWKTNEQVTREFYGGDFSENVAVLNQEIQKFIPQGGTNNAE